MGGGLRGSSLKSPMRLTFLIVLGGGGQSGVAESNIKLLHIAYFIFCVVYIVSFHFSFLFSVL